MTLERKDKEISGGAYVIALVVLLGFTGLSLGLHFVHLGVFNTVAAFSIASVKVLVVAFVFMHLAEAMFATRLIGLVTVLFIAILCLGIVADVAYR